MLEIWFDRAIDAIGISFKGERMDTLLDDNRIALFDEPWTGRRQFAQGE